MRQPVYHAVCSSCGWKVKGDSVSVHQKAVQHTIMDTTDKHLKARKKPHEVTVNQEAPAEEPMMKFLVELSEEDFAALKERTHMLLRVEGRTNHEDALMRLMEGLIPAEPVEVVEKPE